MPGPMRFETSLTISFGGGSMYCGLGPSHVYALNREESLCVAACLNGRMPLSFRTQHGRHNIRLTPHGDAGFVLASDTDIAVMRITEARRLANAIREYARAEAVTGYELAPEGT